MTLTNRQTGLTEHLMETTGLQPTNEGMKRRERRVSGKAGPSGLLVPKVSVPTKVETC